MRRSWLVLAVMATIAGDAHAKRMFCTCPVMITIPERGATNVPTNAKVWSFGTPSPHSYRASDGVDIPNVQVMVPNLEPNRPYANPDWMVDFTTGSDSDNTAPAVPKVYYASVVTLPDGSVQALSVSSQLPSDTAIVRIDIRDSSGATVRLLTTPTRLYMCQPNLHVALGKLHVEVRALDLAGNQSEPVATDIEGATLSSADPDLECKLGQLSHLLDDEGHHHHGHGYEILLFVLVLPACFVGWLVMIVVRRATIKRHLAEPISLLTAEAVARRLIRWQVIWSAMLIAAAIALQFDRSVNDLAVFLAPFILSSLGQLFLQRSALSLLDRPEADAARRGPWLVVTTLRDSVTVRASDIDFVVAKRSSIPTSVAK